MPAGEPTITAKVRHMARIEADAEEIKAMDKSNRPGSATLDAVRKAYANAMSEVADAGSALSVENVELPTKRLK